jgi:UDP-N-acetylmuramoyl-L-alanyl-D-glutamate--2,6-diaminopimelate ligase
MSKKLDDIIQGLNCNVTGPTDIEINKIVSDSRSVANGDLFAAVRGTQVDGHKFISNSLNAGAVAILCEEIPENLNKNVTVIKVKDSAEALGFVASAYYDHPSKNLKLVGVTGTNGKTSIATLSHRLFSELGHKSGLFSTVRNLIGQKEIEATHTTPEVLTIHRLLKEMVDSGCTHAFMEVSSHAVDQRRIAGLDFDLAIFTNLTHDHLDYHKTFDAYLKAKKLFFDHLKANAFALVNVDDKNGRVMIQNTKATVKTFGLHSIADFKARVIESHFDGMLMTIDNTELWTKLIGEFNASNLLAVYAVAILLNLPKTEILRVLSKLDTVEGRFEYVKSNNSITAIIDYAHTPDALKNVLSTINQIRNENCQLITVVGAGGDRDKTKRPVMGKIVSENSDRTILTSDNPRSEDPEVIINEMMAGIEADKRKNVVAITDRREAIRTACMLAKEGDVILIAGKGHENYQEIKGVKRFFSDKQVVSEIFLIDKINLR